MKATIPTPLHVPRTQLRLQDPRHDDRLTRFSFYFFMGTLAIALLIFMALPFFI